MNRKYNYQTDEVWDAVDSFWEFWDKYISEVRNEMD